ncbi:MAG: hypothetical protein IJV88_00405 [Ruminococcus sp.]|nr:hypothetical protein [Ruminococcus sp.]
MKKGIIILITALIMLLLCSCASNDATEPEVSETTVLQATSAVSTEIPTEATTKATEATTAPFTKTTEPATEKTTEPTLTPMQEVPYLKDLPAEVCIFQQADPSSAYMGNIGAEGVYTIVEETRHSDGDLWGKLKSGIGWINLTDPFCDGELLPPVTASYSSSLILNGSYHLAGIHTYDDYKVNVTFYAHETVYDLQITGFDAFSNSPTDTLYTLGELDSQKPLVAHLSFPGDFSAFGLSFQDSNNQTHTYKIYQSGLNGNILMTEY